MKGMRFRVQGIFHLVHDASRNSQVAIRRVMLLVTVFTLCCLVFSLAIVPVAYGKMVSSSELVEHPKKYNGRKVAFRGEVIGEVMVRGDYAWLNVNDDLYSHSDGKKLQGYNSGQSIWSKASEVRDITHTGSYTASGDIVQVEGTFNRACPLHGGDMDIHAIDVSVVEKGHLRSHPLSWPKLVGALLLFALSLALTAVIRLQRMRAATSA